MESENYLSFSDNYQPPRKSESRLYLYKYVRILLLVSDQCRLWLLITDLVVIDILLFLLVRPQFVRPSNIRRLFIFNPFQSAEFLLYVSPWLRFRDPVIPNRRQTPIKTKANLPKSERAISQPPKVCVKCRYQNSRFFPIVILNTYY